MNKYINIIANFFGRGWSILLTIGLTPLYINTLGFEAYGLIGVFATVQSLAAILEMGFPQALNRSVARFTGGASTPEEVSSLFRLFERMFCGFALFLIAIAYPLAIFLSSYWVSFEALLLKNVIYSLLCIIVLVAMRFPIGLYLAILGGLQQQVKMNFLSVYFVTQKLVGAAIVIIFWKNDITVFFIYQILSSIIELVTIRFVTWRAHPEFRPKAVILREKVMENIKFASQIGGITLLGTLIIQADKIILAKKMGLTEFGHYSLIGTIGMGLITLGYPVGTASFPHFSKLIAQKDTTSLRKEFWFYFRIIAAIIIPVTVSLILYGVEFLNFYVDQFLPSNIYLTFQIFIAAAMFGTFTPLPYGLILAVGKSNLVLNFYVVAFVIYLVLVYGLIEKFGIVGAASSFLILQITTFLYFTSIAFKVTQLSNILTTLVNGLLLPFIISMAIGYMLQNLLFLVFGATSIFISLPVILVSSIGILFFILTSQSERSYLIELLRKKM